MKAKEELKNEEEKEKCRKRREIKKIYLLSDKIHHTDLDTILIQCLCFRLSLFIAFSRGSIVQSQSANITFGVQCSAV